MAINVLSVAAGIVLVVLTLNDIFQSVVVPRATGRRLRISFYVWRSAWRVWPAFSWQLYPNDGDRREDLLALFAPFMLLGLMGLWVGLLITGFGLMFWGLRAGLSSSHVSLATALYFSGTSVLTIGFGDIVARAGATRLVSVLAGLAGLSLLSINTAYLFAIFGSFQQRETFVVTVGARAGAPPSGVNLLAIAGYSLTREDLPGLMIDAQRWSAQVMESHLAYPVLAFFRSSHDDQSWVGTLGTLLDAATLLMTTVEGEKEGQARIFYNVGRHATRDLAHYFRIADFEQNAGIERGEFDQACDRLAAAGFTVADRNEAWVRFGELRSAYASQLNELARFFMIPPIAWIGDRSKITPSQHL
ncbi:MAG TPA: potassium channel family protein [Candidatus Cybelea sp.]|nr:potassium channel family protein [Candidatus Cybelea sp.]